MIDKDYKKALNNLNLYDKKTQNLVLTLYKQVNDTLKALIVDNDIQLSKAQQILTKKYNEALLTTDFVGKWQAITLDVIVESSYLATTITMGKKSWGEYLLNKSLFDDNIKLSRRIRINSLNIIRDQKRILRKSLSEGKTIAEIVGNIAQDNLKGFKRELPKYIDELKSLFIAGEKISPKYISAIRRQIDNLKTQSLRADYNRLINTLELGNNADKAVYFAMERRTKYYAQRLARSETLRTLAVVKNHEAVKDPDTMYVLNVTSGSNPCNYCIAVEDLGYVPIESASIPTHHPHCSCTVEYKKSLKKPEPLSKKEYTDKLKSAIDKQNKKAESQGKSKTYIDPQPPVNLRKEGDLIRDLD